MEVVSYEWGTAHPACQLENSLTVNRVRQVTRKAQALAGFNFLRAVAELLPGGSPETPLEHLEGMRGDDMRRFCEELIPAVEKLRLAWQEEALRGRIREGDGGQTAGPQVDGKSSAASRG